MAKKPKKQRQTETRTPPEIPPGASRRAHDRPREPGGGPPGSGAGPRHAAGDPGSDVEATGRTDATPTEAGSPPPEEDVPEQGPPYSGHSGGAVGGTPTQDRSSGGRTRRGIAPGGVHRGDSTVGTDPESTAE